jgi:hypothetical protein
VIDAVGEITARVQRQSDAALRVPERGIFSVRFALQPSEEEDDLRRVLREGAEAGYLHIYEDEPSGFSFRLHCSLAAAYGSSYRGAYYPLSVSPQSLIAIENEPDGQVREKLVLGVAKAFDADSAGQLSLEGIGDI